MHAPFLAINLRFYRVLLRLSQHQLALRAGPPFSQSVISRLERGLQPSESSQIDALARALNLSQAALLREPRRALRADAVRPAVLGEES
jgi:transcriptional regulator with XRE-family HTH domain